ncbi:uncharacterized protein MONBRDRAFT_37026 [Monosiga brevicollis MX1]|uniref:Phosphoribosyltransferase domain-containing protein n=1 Tax=Monosiga brevicollis TaxID=81824 RepID=A9UZ44_MONBE|nr:uncharacterized protein MONBRDRAFT_37026 [Monosiga brevicollis MX1]EDQ89568.1 predicted protein [Monosiga brevicollis MX1]|eukprot:XP_001745597.1 hypothetical protein [Monosiga brevicollis MX1]
MSAQDAAKRETAATSEVDAKRSRADQPKPFVSIPDNFDGYALDSFCIPKHYEDSLERILLPHGIIMDRVAKMARDIVSDLEYEPLTCLCILKGGHQFFADLVDRIKMLNESGPLSLPLRIDFIRAKSYEDDHSTGKVQIIGGDNMESIRGRNVLIVEDMIDTGNTMVKLLATLREYEPKTLRVASLFVKRTPLSNGYKPHCTSDRPSNTYPTRASPLLPLLMSTAFLDTGFEVPNHFVVGYALDYNEYFRDLPHVAILNDTGKEKYKMSSHD